MPRADFVRPDAERVARVDCDGHEVTAVIHEWDVTHTFAEQRQDVCGSGTGWCGLRLRIAALPHRGVERAGRIFYDPTAEVAVRERTAKNAVGIHTEDNALAVGVDLGQGREDRVLREDNVGRQLAFDNH